MTYWELSNKLEGELHLLSEEETKKYLEKDNHLNLLLNLKESEIKYVGKILGNCLDQYRGKECFNDVVAAFHEGYQAAIDFYNKEVI